MAQSGCVNEADRKGYGSASVCENCRKPLRAEQTVCPSCGAVQENKLWQFPPNLREELRALSRTACLPLEQQNPDITWDRRARAYANSIAKARAIARSAGSLKPGVTLDQEIDGLLDQCRNAEFQIAVVGVLKAGKSTLLNALTGAELAATGLNSTTAALTKFRSSRQGHYVKVRFYSAEEWKQLNASARAGGPGRSGEDASLLEKLDSPSVQEAASTWVGHAPVFQQFSSLPEFRAGILRWTAANSDDHLFAAEVEAGIDRALFDMPEEVVFVDTPGLHDPVKYRSQITQRYIESADAVLVAVKPDALSEESFATITTVLDHAGTKKQKVFIVGTQKDKLQRAEDYGQLVDGAGGWVEQLVRAGRYRSRTEAQNQILTVSAYLHLCLNRFLELPPEALDDPERFSDADFNNLELGVRKALNVRRCDLFSLRENQAACRQAFESFGVDRLKKRLDQVLISRFRDLKVDAIRRDYARCRRKLLALMRQDLDERNQKVRAAKEGAGVLARNAAAARAQRDRLERRRWEMEEKLQSLHKLIDGQIQALDLYRRE